jgi:NADH:ubiquinone oxidoreductase subunit 6 (subunit J)
MKSKLFNNLLLFSLFGIGLGFFGVLYEGVVYGPKLLDVSMERMLFWKEFTSVISPIVYYVPWVYLATIMLVVLYFKTQKEKKELKKRLKLASIFQILSLVLTIYILAQINFKRSFGDLEKYADTIPGKVLLFNILSIIRVTLAAIGLSYVFKAYVQTQKEQVN